MNKLFFCLFITVTLLFTPIPVFASAKLVDYGDYAKIQERNLKIKTLANFFKLNNSPLESYSATFIDEAEKNELNWKLIPAITGVESSFGKAIPKNSYNAYGWNNGDYYFKSWEEGIIIVSKTLNEKYRQGWGADDPYEIGRYYAASPTWANRVVSFMKQIENTSSNLALLPLNL